jgi:hypothetical protein
LANNAPTFVNPRDANAYSKVVQEFAALADEFYKKRNWGEITVIFREGVPMNIGSKVTKRLDGAEQIAVSKGAQPNGKPEYR